jgi:flavin reductase (DIM6/NTAB) family NADH-FMN oxidoreductase RutF
MISPSAATPLARHADPDEFRRSVSLFATGIVVLTCEDDDGRVHGMTVNSFTSVSLDPPTVLVSLKAGKAHRLISRNGRYGACILHADQQRYSTYFSGQPQETLHPDFTVRGSIPTLRKCLAWFACETVDKVQIHDHTLFVANVTACGSESGVPLMFFGSRYHRSAIAA